LKGENMNFINTVLYFVGLVISAVSVGVFYNIPEFALFIIGVGMVVYAIATTIAKYLKPHI
jgi:hypothetical protein